MRAIERAGHVGMLDLQLHRDRKYSLLSYFIHFCLFVRFFCCPFGLPKIARAVIFNASFGLVDWHVICLS
jgi:hypothetical protein